MEIRVASGDISKVKADAVIVNHYEGIKHPEGDAAVIDKALGGVISQLIRQGEIKGKANETTLVHSLGKLPSARVVIVGLGRKSGLTDNKVRNAAAETCRWLRRKGISNIASVAQGAGINGISPESSAQAITEGAVLGLYAFRRYLTKKENNFGEIKTIVINGSRKDRPRLEQGIDKGRIMAESANWARDLVNEPSNYMTPERMAETARQLAGESRIKVEVLEKEQMVAEGMGGLLGVSQGSQQPPKLIILNYKGKESDGIDLALVGKGITFDSGGISIKPSEGMSEMKGDMAGGASVMAALKAIDRLDAKINIVGIIPATENLPSGTAMKPGDIITAMNGETIEVLNTDAEGRLILADALCYAKKLGAKSIIDIATLTGACHVALGDICTGAFTNNRRLVDKLLATGKEVGEYAWELPMYEEYREAIKSDIADIKNIGNRYGGAITAAKFLADFVKNTPWVHLDIAGTFETKSTKGYLVKGATGVPVRTLVNLVLSLAKQ